MKEIGIYKIPFAGLKFGKHIFTFEIGEKFFKIFDQPPVSEGDLYVHLTFDKRRENFFVLDFFIDGSIHSECDRCLRAVEIQINGSHQLIIKTVADFDNIDLNDPTVMYIVEEDISINVAQLLFEYISLNIPIRKTCEDDIMGNKQCNQKVMRILKGEQEEKQVMDPRWDSLKNLKTE